MQWNCIFIFWILLKTKFLNYGWPTHVQTIFSDTEICSNVWTQTSQSTKDKRNFHQSFIPNSHSSYSVNDLKLLVTSSTTPRELKRIKSCSYPEAVETVNINFIIISYWHLLIWSTWLWESRFGIVIVFFICKLFCTFLKVQLTNYTHHILVATSEGAVCQHTIEGVSMTLLTILMICFIV